MLPQPGHEDSTVLRILKRVELFEYARFKVHSVVAHDRYPGRILVEAESSIDVVGVCNGILHVFANKWKVALKSEKLLCESNQRNVVDLARGSHIL